MKQLHFSGLAVAVAAFAAVVTLTQKELHAAIAGKDKSASDAVRASDASKRGVADAKGAPPAWIVSSTGIVARAEAGDTEAMRQYGALLASGENVKKDLDKGLLWLQKAFHYGDESAALHIELYHQAAYEQLFVELRDKAEAGDKEAADRFNKCMELHRKGLKGNHVSLIESRALVDHAPSQAQLGFAYMLGKSVAQDHAKAVEWLRKAVAQGEYRAMLWLGTAYEHGHGVVKDDWRAFDLWRRSHELGWDPATEKLHSLSDEYRKEAEKGNASAQFFMGVVHEYGYAGKPDAAKAVEWYRKSAAQGHPGAMFNLGACYMEGAGVKKDIAEAAKWFKRAVSLGHERAAEMLEKVQK